MNLNSGRGRTIKYRTPFSDFQESSINTSFDPDPKQEQLAGHILENGQVIKAKKINLEKVSYDHITLDFVGVEQGPTFKPGEVPEEQEEFDYGDGVTVIQTDKFKQQKLEEKQNRIIPEGFNVFQKMAQMKEEKFMKAS